MYTKFWKIAYKTESESNLSQKFGETRHKSVHTFELVSKTSRTNVKAYKIS